MNKLCLLLKCAALTCLPLMFASGCGNDSDENNGADATPPSFAAQPFAYTKAKWKSASLTEGDDTSISCETELEQENNASKALGLALLASESEEADIALAMASRSYAMGLFYDCNMRQQAAEDGVEVVAADDDNTHYRSYRPSEEFWDNTRFVEWHIENEEGEIPQTADEAEDVRGTMVNLYLQDNNNFRTQTRIELQKENEEREITSTFYLHDPENGKVVQRAHLVEHDAEGGKEHLLSLRLFHLNKDAKIYLSLAHLKNDGSAVLVATCDIAETEDYNKSCAGTEMSEAFFYDDNLELITDDPPADEFKTSTDEFLSAEFAGGDFSGENLNPLTPFFAGTNETKTNRENFFKDGLPAE